MIMNNIIQEITENSQIIIEDATVSLFKPAANYETVINVSAIASILIENAGRWCKHYASDVIISWDEVREKLSKHVKTLDVLETDIITFAFRQSGVDSNHYLLNRIEDGTNISLHYSEIFAVHIMDVINDDNIKTVYVTLKDIKSTAESAAYHNRK